MLWDDISAATTLPSELEVAVWSPCDRFIAITLRDARTVDILDSTTLQRLQTLEPPQDVSVDHRGCVFSPDSRILTCYSGGPSTDPQDFVVSWDLQTGGVASVIRWREPTEFVPIGRFCVTSSANGKMVGGYRYGDHRISVCDVAAGAFVRSHSLDVPVFFPTHIWTHGESLRLAVVSETTIAIWEVGFTPGATLTEVEVLPTPDGFYIEYVEGFQLLPTPCRLACISWGYKVLVWDVRNSRCLLECMDTDFNPRMSFSSNGHFFACPALGSDIYLWKESPAGYILHRILALGTGSPSPLLARNGESVLAFDDSTIKLLYTKRFTTSTSGVLTQGPPLDRHFILEFSPDGTLAVVAIRAEKKVVVLNLKSGALQFTFDAGVDVYGLGVIGDTVVAIGDREVIFWDLPTGDYVPGAWVGLEGTPRTLKILSDEDSPYPRRQVRRASISPDSRRIAVLCLSSLYIHSASTGELLWSKFSSGYIPRFSQDGREVWCAYHSGAKVWRVGGRWEAPEHLELTADMKHLPDGHPWEPSGYRVTDDWWILGSDGKRLLMLPPRWQSYPMYRVWKGRSLALLHSGLPEPVILELEIDREL